MRGPVHPKDALFEEGERLATLPFHVAASCLVMRAVATSRVSFFASGGDKLASHLFFSCDPISERTTS